MFLKHLNNKFKLKILKYQYKQSDFPEDLEWLVCKIFIKNDFMKYKIKDPCLQYKEIQGLIDFLKIIKKKSNYKKELKWFNFENTITFTKTKNNFLIIELLHGSSDCQIIIKTMIDLLADTQINDSISYLNKIIKKYKRKR
jgi:hypothetical protein